MRIIICVLAILSIAGVDARSTSPPPYKPTPEVTLSDIYDHFNKYDTDKNDFLDEKELEGYVIGLAAEKNKTVDKD
jgi:hypothetical protein